MSDKKNGTSTPGPSDNNGSKEPKIPPHLNWRIVIGSGLFAIGLFLLVALLSGMMQNKNNGVLGTVAGLLAVVGLVFLGVGINKLKDIIMQSEDDPTKIWTLQEAKFQRYLIGLGYTLAVLCVCNVLFLAGRTASQKAGQDIFKSEQINYLFSLSMALTGVLFFIASKIHKYSGEFKASTKAGSGSSGVNPPPGTDTTAGTGQPATQAVPEGNPQMQQPGVEAPEEFCKTKFWGGLWYRVGESILFSLVMILLFQKSTDDKMQFSLPVICLMMGMFIESAEKFVVSLSERMFEAVKAFYGKETK